MNSQEKAYLAGLLDGDGSILLQLRRRKGMKYLFRVKAVVVFYQHTKLQTEMELLQKIINAGYIYQRNDNIFEIRVEGFTQVERLLTALQPYIRFKRKQVASMLKAVAKLKVKPISLETFLDICELSDQISAANYSSKLRKYTKGYVISELEKHHILPVTTGSQSHLGEDSAV